jgi:transcriptional regulator GlxA family with amidase domain
MGCSARSLQAAFKAAGAAPVREALASARLDGARAALMAAGPGDSVASIAAAAGVSQLGRFAARYRARFGESPSATLARAPGRLG